MENRGKHKEKFFLNVAFGWWDWRTTIRACHMTSWPIMLDNSRGVLMQTKTNSRHLLR